jgi:hypothetical protein
MVDSTLYDCERLSFLQPAVSFASRCDSLWHGTRATRRARQGAPTCPQIDAVDRMTTRMGGPRLANDPAPAMQGGGRLVLHPARVS